MVRVWDSATGKEERQFSFGVNPYALSGVVPSPDGKHILVADEREPPLSVGTMRVKPPPMVRVIDMETWKEVHRFECPTNPKGVSFSPDGRFAAAGSWRGFIYHWQMPGIFPAEASQESVSGK